MTTDKPRAYTAEEARGRVLDHIRALRDYWANETRVASEKDRLDGLCFSILVMFDGCAGGLPAMDIHLAPHPSDANYQRRQGENWFEPGMMINDCQMHDEWYHPRKS